MVNDRVRRRTPVRTHEGMLDSRSGDADRYPTRTDTSLTLKTNPYESPASSSPATGVTREYISLICAVASTAILLSAAFSTHFDRTQRVPVVSFHGPIASLRPGLSYVGWVLSFAAIGFAVYAMDRRKLEDRTSTSIALALAIANLVIGGFYVGANLEN